MSILDKVTSSDDIKKLSYEELRLISDEIRAFLIENVSKTGGHIASNLGAVELSLALNKVYDPNIDRIVFDVGHQCYTHKIINGRKDDFGTLRTLNGISGFPKPKESDTDAFVAGHSSNSISVALGMAKARTLSKKDYNVCAVIGDGALTGGLAYEGLENVASSKEKILIILNDNAMSISTNVGGMNRLLQRMRTNPDYFKFKRKFRAFVGIDSYFYLITHKIKEKIKKRLLRDNVFADMGLEYLGPVDGHNVEELCKVINWAKDMDKPVLLHVITVKGKGVPYTSEYPDKYHGVGPFDPVTGYFSQKKCFSDVFGEKLCDIADVNKSVVAVTAAMTSGTGLTKFSEFFPNRFFDVGIAEEHAVSMCGGMSKQGLVPVFAVYSTFLQRAYDMLLHDISLLNLHVVFAVDRAGIVGQDGETHNGVFDVSYLSSVPGMKIYCPASYKELSEMLDSAVNNEEGPVAIRYPRGGEGKYTDSHLESETILKSGNSCTIISYGILINNVLEAVENKDAEVIKLNVIKPNDFRCVCSSVEKTGNLIVVEDVCSPGCIGGQIIEKLFSMNIRPKNYRLLNLGTGIVPQGTVEQIYNMYNINSNGIVSVMESFQ